MEDSDSQLVKSTLSGNAEAFSELVKRHHLRVMAIVFCLLKVAPDAENISQSVFVKAYERLASLEDHAKFGKWVGAIAMGLSREFLKKNHRNPIKLEDLRNLGVINSPLEKALVKSENLTEIILALLGELDEESQVIFSLRFYAEMSYVEICDFTGTPFGRVKTSIRNSVEHVRERLAPYVLAI